MKTAEDILSQKRREMVSFPADRTVREAIQRMNEKKIGAILVTREDAVAGIWTERDLIRNILRSDFNMDTDPVGNHMTTEIHSADHDAELTKLQEMFLGLFIRHILIRKRRGPHRPALHRGRAAGPASGKGPPDQGTQHHRRLGIL